MVNLETIRKNTILSSGVALMIDNYISVIRRNVMEDKELIDICNKIYNKHKKALDLIFEYRTDPTQTSSIVKEILQEMANNGEIIYDKSNSSTYIRFYTKEMNKTLPNLVNKNSSWKNEHCYAYEFKMMNGKFRLSCVLTAQNLPEETANMVKKILMLEKTSKKTLDFKWLQLHLKKCNILDDNDDVEKIKNTIKKAIKDLLTWEKILLDKLSKNA